MALPSNLKEHFNKHSWTASHQTYTWSKKFVSECLLFKVLSIDSVRFSETHQIWINSFWASPFWETTVLKNQSKTKRKLMKRATRASCCFRSPVHCKLEIFIVVVLLLMLCGLRPHDANNCSCCELFSYQMLEHKVAQIFPKVAPKVANVVIP